MGINGTSLEKKTKKFKNRHNHREKERNHKSGISLGLLRWPPSLVRLIQTNNSFKRKKKKR
jgi:hypothetical protein